MANAVFGMGVTVAPVLGPVFGGWITDQWNWPCVLYQSPGRALAFFLIKGFIHDPTYQRDTRIHIDNTWGILFLSVGLGCLR